MRVFYPLLLSVMLLPVVSFRSHHRIVPSPPALPVSAGITSTNVLLDTDLKKKTLDDLLLQYKGKLVLIDFWASWCAPCRVQLLFEHRLEQKYAQKDIVFLFVSLDQDVTRWKKATVSENLARSRSYLLYDAVNSDLFKSYKIHSIPRCMLIGRDGNMLNDDAPWPYDAKLQQLIDKSLG